MGNKHDCFMIAIFGATVLHDSDVGDALFMGPANCEQRRCTKEAIVSGALEVPSAARGQQSRAKEDHHVQ